MVSQVAVATSYAGRATALDPAFGKDGAVVAQVVPGMANAATAVAVQSDGDVLVGGSAGTAQTGVPAASGFVVRLLANGSLDPSFGDSGVVKPASLAPVTQVAQTSGGHILALGGSLILLDRNGTRDTRFGLGGVAVLPSAFTAQSFVVEADGDIALVGTVTQPDATTAAALVRLTSTGQPDPSFGTDSLVVLPPPVDQAGHPLIAVTPGGLVVQPNGDIVLTVRGGPSGSSATGSFPGSVLERVTPSGEIDTSFGQNGQAVIAGDGETVGTFDPQLTANGDILVPVIVGGGTGLLRGPILIAISPAGQELNPENRLIAEFESVGAFAALPGGGYLVLDAGYYFNVAKPNLTGVDIETSGAIFDNPLGYQIPVTLPDRGSDPGLLLAVQPDGKLLIAGTAPAANGEQAMFVARLSGLSKPAVVELPRQRIRRGTRTITLRLTCSPAQACNGKANLYLSSHGRHTRLAVGSGSFSIAPGRSREVTVTLTHTGRVRLGEHALARVTLTLSLADGATRSGTIILPGASATRSRHAQRF